MKTGSKKQPKPAAMSPEEFRAILDSNAINQRQAAAKLGYCRLTINEWCRGHRPINERNAAYIRSVLGSVPG